MKILKYIIFLSILSGIFFLIYRQSDEEGFRKLWTSFKIAVFIAAVLAGLITTPAEAIEPDVPVDVPKYRTAPKTVNPGLGVAETSAPPLNSKPVPDRVGSKAPKSRTVSRQSFMSTDLNQDNSTQSEFVPTGDQLTIGISRGGATDQPGKSSKFGPGSKAKGAAKRDLARRQVAKPRIQIAKTSTSKQSGGDLFADGFGIKPTLPTRQNRVENKRLDDKIFNHLIVCI